MEIPSGLPVTFSTIVAASTNGVIGRDGAIPWRLRSDMRAFVELTTGHTVIMGRKTCKSLPRPLRNRTCIVLTTQPDFQREGFIIAHSWAEAFAAIPAEETQVFFIGGERIYQETLPLASRIYLTRVHAEIEGDAHFELPELSDGSCGWYLAENASHMADEDNQYGFTFEVYARHPFGGMIYDMNNYRTEEQRLAMQDSQDRGVCLFCWHNIWADGKRRPIIDIGKWWLVTTNLWPYDHAEHHFLLIYREHPPRPGFAESADYDMTDGAMIEIAQHIRNLTKRYDLRSAAFLQRFGDMQRNGSSVDHAHGHVTSGYPEGHPQHGKYKAKIIA